MVASYDDKNGMGMQPGMQQYWQPGMQPGMPGANVPMSAVSMMPMGMYQSPMSPMGMGMGMQAPPSAPGMGMGMNPMMQQQVRG